MAETLDLTPDELLTTTRAVRKRLDLEREVPDAVLRECLELAVQAPTGSNVQHWHFVFVRDPAKRKRIGELYGDAFRRYRAAAEPVEQRYPDDPERQRTQERVISSAEYLAENLGEVPVHLVPCVEARVEEAGAMAQASTYGSILPAVWSFMLAARTRGLGTCWTTLHLAHEREVGELLGIPQDTVTQVALIPVAYTLGTGFKPAPRKPLDGVMHVDGW